MTLQNGRAAAAMATALAFVLSLVAVPDAAAVATATGAGIRITDPNGGPVARATVSLTFNGETKTAQTDDDGVVAIFFGDSRSAPAGSVVLPKDGSGTISYPGGPKGGEAFTVRGGLIVMARGSRMAHDIGDPPRGQPPAPRANPEAEAENDLATIGQDKTRAQAVKRLRDAVSYVYSATPTSAEGYRRVRERPREAVRYYAKAHGLSGDIDDLIDSYEILIGTEKSEVGVAKPDPAEAAKQYGAGWEQLFEALDMLRDWQQSPLAPPPTPVTAAPASAEGGKGIGKKPLAIAGAGVVVVGGGALLLGGDSDDNGTGDQPDFSGLSGSFTTTMIVRCGQQQSSTMVPVIMTVGAAEASCTDASQQGPCRQCTKSKGGLPVPCTIDENGRYHGIFSGPISGLSFVQNGANIRWAWLGNILRGTPARLTANSTIIPTSPGASSCSQLEATMNSN